MQIIGGDINKIHVSGEVLLPDTNYIAVLSRSGCREVRQQITPQQCSCKVVFELNLTDLCQDLGFWCLSVREGDQEIYKKQIKIC